MTGERTHAPTERDPSVIAAAGGEAFGGAVR
jgi:hypothetical protein